MKACRLLLTLALVFVLNSLPAIRAQEKTVPPVGPPSSKTGLLLTDKTALALIHHSSGDLAHDYVSQLSLWDRSQVTEGYRRTAEWVSQQAKEFGLEQVGIEPYPSDGTARYFGNRTQRLWKVKKGELLMKSPFEMKLTSYSELPMSLCRNSLSTNVEAELIDVGRGERSEEH